jgi:hypothetical protein
MPYISVNSPRGFQTHDTDEGFLKDNSKAIMLMITGEMPHGHLTLDDGYGNMVVYGSELLRQSVVTIGGLKK